MYNLLHMIKTRLYAIRVPLLLIILITALTTFSSCGADLAASAGNISSDTSVENQAEEETEFNDSIEEDYDDESLGNEDYEEAEEDGQVDDDTGTYKIVLNSNPSRMRYHFPDCRGVDDISEAHYQEYELTAEEIKEKQENAGWIPCGWCHPDRKLGIDQ